MEESPWKDRLRAQFESVLAEMEDAPDVVFDDEVEESTPDIYTFYEELAALRHEVRQGNRRTAEAFSQFGESMSGFDAELKRARDHRQTAAQPSEEGLPKALRLPFVELADRIERLREAFADRPSSEGGWFGRRAVTVWKQVWEERCQAVHILADHVEAMLGAAGLTPIPVLGKRFDPMRMSAVARDDDASASDGELVVVEEITRGYLHLNDIVRLAEVRVGKA